jgi:polysaccharide biosynthesis transport protein
MSDQNLPQLRRPDAVQARVAEWDEDRSFAPKPAQRSPLDRPLSAIRRYRYLVAGVFLLAVAGGFVATRFVTPKYEVRATIWIQSETPISDRNGPIRSKELLNSEAWVELLRSYRISDEVVRRLALYVRPKDPADSSLFKTFTIADQYVKGKYELRINQTAKTWSLTSAAAASFVDTGRMADSVGRKMGLKWVLPAYVFNGTGEKKVEFTVSTPRETAVALTQRLGTRLADRSNFLWLTLAESDGQLAATTLNTWVREYVSVAAELKKRNMVDFQTTLEGQLRFADTAMRNAETALENFRVHTITLPTEGGPVAAGVEMTRDPALKAFFEQKIAYDNLKHDRESLEKTIASAAGGAVPYESALLIPSVAESPGGKALRDAFDQLYKEEANLATARQGFTDKYRPVQELATSVEILKTKTIPGLASQLLTQLREREAEYARRITSSSTELQRIPVRTIEEMRLRRAVNVAEGLYTNLKARYAEAQLATASATPDVTIMDSAVAPLQPSKNTKTRILAMAIAAGLAAAIGLAVLLDMVDPRFRYADQADELGLAIAGAVPALPKGGINPKSPEQVFQLVESFRSIRMSVTHAVPIPLSLAVSSPAPGDGKSFVSANLAMSFAEAGYRTLLIDGDTRRGGLHETFGVPRKPGLTDYLRNAARRDVVIYPTSHEKLFVVPSGTRQRSSPELLASAGLDQFLADLRKEFDVVLCDTPPFAAGIDAYAIATAAQHLVVVLRVGKTQRRLAAARLSVLSGLPVDVIGTVVNSVQLSGDFEYYGYADSYQIDEDERDAPALAQPG